LALLADLIDEMVAVASYLLDALIDLIPFSLGTFIRDNFTNLTLTTLVDDLFSLLLWAWGLGQFLAYLIMIGLGFYMFVIPFMQDDPGKIPTDIARNAFHLHGWNFNTGLGNVTIPIRVNALIVWLFLVLAFGYLSWIIPFSLF